MISILLVIHVLLSLAIIGLVLLQRGKGAEAGASLGGGGSSGSVFGARGAANFLSRSTAILAASFFATSLGLAFLSSNLQTGGAGNDSVIEQTVVVPDTDMPTALDAPATSDVPSAPASELPPATE